MNDESSQHDDERQAPNAPRRRSMTADDGIERITAPTAEHFRNWLSLHHATARAVWLVYFKKHTTTPSITWTEAVDEALCFGWIDSTARTLDADRYEQYFTRRRPNSPWSRVNKDKIVALQRVGKITAAGYAAIDDAKRNGSWTAFDDAENLVVPDDLATALRLARAHSNFDELAPSRRRSILYWINSAKRPGTRRRRIDQTVRAASQQTAPNRF